MLHPFQPVFRVLAVAAALVFLLAGWLVVSPARADYRPPDNYVKIIGAAVSVPVAPNTISSQSLDIYWNSADRAILSARPEGNGDVYFYDHLELSVNAGPFMSAPYYCQAPSNVAAPAALPWDISRLLRPGLNHLEIEIRNDCAFGNSDLYLSGVAGLVPRVLGSSVTEPQELVLPNCPRVQFFGVRGSGERSDRYGGFGQTVAMLRNQLFMMQPGLVAAPIDYPAIPVNPFQFDYSSAYVDSVEKGAGNLYDQLHELTRLCPHTYFILAGYSQGAEAVDLAYARLSNEERMHVASVTLFGDPRFNPDQWQVNRGDYSPLLSGIDISVLGDLQSIVPTGWDGRVESYCTLGDPICNYDIRNVPACIWITRSTTCVHGQYFDRGWVSAAAKTIADRLRSLPRLV